MDPSLLIKNSRLCEQFEEQLCSDTMAIGRDTLSENGIVMVMRCRGGCCRPRRFDSCSQPFGKPSISERCVGVSLRFCTKSLSFQSKKNTVLTTDQNKHLIKKVAKEMNRISEDKVTCLLTSINEDYMSLNECRSFILQWAAELRSIPSLKDRTTPERGQCHNTRQITSTQKDELMEARTILSEWAASLKSLPKGSVCAAEDVRSVLEDLGRQWKRGQLPNMLPALDFIMRSVLQEHSLKYPVQLNSHRPHQILVH
ncbi:hypothetical protein AALO_G00036260 [Alosa alosa]|uniref:Uncharacterized protein n=1 Tax=Alosa alosa TaxID=278164 RepID=A0AAV6H6S4_9TELE|nr:uncharacterized protein zgc:113314 [Alosa alosa]KAG5282928.1 hypothetical protein AALO_G00036260 [Alosa alosa]